MHITHSGNGKLVCDARLRSFASRRSASGGARRSRTDDILLAKQALYQLSYGPFSGSSQESCRRTVQMDPRGLVGPGRLELPTLRLSGVRSNHLSYRPHLRPFGLGGQARAAQRRLHLPHQRGKFSRMKGHEDDGNVLWNGRSPSRCANRSPIRRFLPISLERR